MSSKLEDFCFYWRYTKYDCTRDLEWHSGSGERRHDHRGGNHYFPPESINRDLLADSATHTHCPWKGDASYYSLNVNGDTNTDAVWYYPKPFDVADVIKDYVAFWRGVEVTADDTDGTPGPNPPGR